ncbi:cupin domain-containing protein [Bradyrhizobium erythrophlei]|uniref:Oxalate decarboxylase n=1 Tax=Bradyrhizobium erythrophlei TaxID=1437360 RepID=A0A1M7U5T6_9BRAD|nr:cupin domain-containing protein [Bradyrhizobium erythrophlei]SHN78284.1 oxalate decarboxylase [Bradyrhizobium erythrophlei]
MNPISRRNILAVGAAGGLLAASSAAMGQTSPQLPQPSRAAGVGGNVPGPRDITRDRENPDMLNPPSTDQGTLPNLRFSFADAHTKQSDGGWTRQVTQRELGISTTLAGVEMRLDAGSIRELHWHKQAEWAYMLYGTARITAIDQDGNNFVDDVGVGDLWYFPGGVPHSIQGLGPDGCEFLLVFDDGSFDEDDTFLITDWFKRIPQEVLGKNFGVSGDNFAHLPDPSQRYIFKSEVPGPLGPDRLRGAKPVPLTFKHQLMAQDPIRTKGGTVRIADSSVFKASKNIAVALVEIEPGGMRELHWHPNVDEWQYYIEGQARMGVFAAQGAARTFDYRAGDVGYVPFAMGHYIENTGNTPVRFLEMFRSSYYADLSLDQWMALTPPQLLRAHFPLDQTVMDSLHKKKYPVVPA